MTPWQLIFLNSKANGAFYSGEHLPRTPWTWPRETWLSRKLEEIKNSEAKVITERSKDLRTPTHEQRHE